MNGGSKETERKLTLRLWQEEWSSIPTGTPASKVRDLIPDIKVWARRPQLGIDFFTIQVVTGHGLSSHIYIVWGKLPQSVTFLPETVGDHVHTL